MMELSPQKVYPSIPLQAKGYNFSVDSFVIPVSSQLLMSIYRSSVIIDNDHF